MKVRHTAAGLAAIDLSDADQQYVILQESSEPSSPHLHFGIAMVDTSRSPANGCAHLDQQMVRDLLPHLMRFAETGEIE